MFTLPGGVISDEFSKAATIVRTEQTADDDGNYTVTETEIASDVTVDIQPFTRKTWDDVNFGIQGETLRVTKMAYMMPASGVQNGDHLVTDDNRYVIVRVDDLGTHFELNLAEWKPENALD